MTNLAGQVAVVTGINGLLGPVWGRALLEAGASVWGLDVKPEPSNSEVSELLAKHAGRFHVIGASVTERSSLEHARALIVGTGLARLQGRTVGLDGVVDQQENYRKSGFVLAHRNIRYQGTGVRSANANAAIIPLSKLPFGEISTYDRQFFPDTRVQFLKCWINQPQGAALGFVQGSALAGYGVLRPCRSGYKVGPLFADTPVIAEDLFLALQQGIPHDAPIFLDTPAVNGAALDLARRHNMRAVFETARMYANGKPDLPLERIFGVTSFELG